MPRHLCHRFRKRSDYTTGPSAASDSHRPWRRSGGEWSASAKPPRWAAWRWIRSGITGAAV